MMDVASVDAAELALLGDFNVDLMKPQNLWIEKTFTYNLSQLLDSPAKITSPSKTLTDNIYALDKHNICEMHVPVYCCNDHLPICLTRNKKGRKSLKLAINKLPIDYFQISIGNISCLTFQILGSIMYAVIQIQKSLWSLAF